MDRAIPVADGLTRRGLLVLGAGAAGTALAVQLAGPGAVIRPRYAALKRSAFTPHVGSPFQLHLPTGAAQTVRLDRIDDHRLAPGSDDAFVLTFRAPRHAPRLDQDVMTVRAPDANTFNLLVAPSSTGLRGQDYAAVIYSRPLL